MSKPGHLGQLFRYLWVPPRLTYFAVGKKCPVFLGKSVKIVDEDKKIVFNYLVVSMVYRFASFLIALTILILGFAPALATETSQVSSELRSSSEGGVSFTDDCTTFYAISALSSCSFKVLTAEQLINDIEVRNIDLFFPAPARRSRMPSRKEIIRR